MEKPHSPVDLEREKLTGNGTKAFEDVEAVVPKNANSKRCMYVIMMTQVTLFIQLGMLITSLNPATPALSRFFNRTYEMATAKMKKINRYYNGVLWTGPLPGFKDRYAEAASDDTLRLLVTLTLAMVMGGAIVGSAVTKFFALNMSRRTALICYHSLTLLSIVLMSFVTYFFGSWEAIIAGRFINGFARGFGMNVVTLYVAEMSCVEDQPKSQSPPGWLIGVGFLLGVVAGHPKVMGNDELWPYLVALPGLLSVYYLLNVCVVPNTPAHYLRCGKGNDALRQLRRLRKRNQAAVNAEFSELEKVVRDVSITQHASLAEIFTNSAYRSQFLSACAILINVQTIGFVNILLYSDATFTDAGVSPENATFPSIGVCAEMTIIAYIGAIVIKKLNRRKLLISGNFLIIVACFVLCVSTSLKDSNPAMPYVSIFATLVYALGVGGGPILVSFPLLVDSISRYPRAQAPILIMAGTLFWIAASIVGFSGPYLFKFLGAFSWLVYGGVTTMFTTIFIFVIKLPC